MVFLASAVGFVIAPCLAILCLTTLLPLHAYTLSRVIWAACYVVAAGFSFNSGTKLWRLAVGMIRPKATLDTEGVRFRMVSDKPADFQEQFVPWDQIAAIRHRRMGNSQLYSVVTKDNLVIALRRPGLLSFPDTRPAYFRTRGYLDPGTQVEGNISYSLTATLLAERRPVPIEHNSVTPWFCLAIDDRHSEHWLRLLRFLHLESLRGFARIVVSPQP